MRYFLLMVMFVSMALLKISIAPLESNLPAREMLTMGFMILAGYQVGKIAKGIGLPMLTGYLLAGIVCGPELLGFVTEDVREGLRIIDEMALSLIAFNAGGEMELEWLRSKARTLIIILLGVVAAVFVGVTGFMYVLLSTIPLLEDASSSGVFAAALVLGAMATGMSPATTIAIMIETKAKGVLSETVLALTVAADMVIIILFTLVMAVAKMLTDPHAHFDFHTVGEPILVEIGGSFIAGGIVGLFMTLYLNKLGQAVIFGILAISVIVIEVSEITHLSLLLVCMVAGFLVKNFSSQGETLIHGIERGSVGIYIIFFTLAGTELDFGTLAEVWHVGLLLFAVRAFFFFVGTYGSALVAGAEDSVRNWAWSGFIGQAGVSLGMALLVQQRLPDLGPSLTAVIMSGIILNQIIGPVVFMYALRRTGEAHEEQEA